MNTTLPNVLMNMKLKQQLKLLLHEKRFTASELSRLSGVPKQSISDWLSGTHPRNLSQLKKVAAVLDVSIDELCFGKTESSEPKSNVLDIENLIGDQWIAGLFEVRLRRVKR